MEETSERDDTLMHEHECESECSTEEIHSLRESQKSTSCAAWKKVANKVGRAGVRREENPPRDR
jgi:hypothetical protein